jgi:hypothetical protein
MTTEFLHPTRYRRGPRPSSGNGANLDFRHPHAVFAVAGPSDLQALGELELTIQSSRVVHHEFRRHRVAASTLADPNVERALARYR